MNSLRSARRSAFTLVELLVVIVIIGILVALLVPTIGGAMRKAKVARIGLEISNLADAVERYKAEKLSYPPDFAVSSTVAAANAVELQIATQINGHMARNFRNRKPQIDIVANAAVLDPAEALVFWLSGFSKNVQAPLSGRQPVEYEPGFFSPPLKGEPVYYEFDPTRLKDRDQDGYPEYYPPDGEFPYVYIRSDSYAFGPPQANGTFVADSFQVLRNAPNSGVPVRPYAAELGDGNAVKRFAAHEKYQIICAGADNSIGAGSSQMNGSPAQVPAPPVYADGIGYTEADDDNITNFSEGLTLKDAIP